MIASFTGEHRWLSNFWPCKIEQDGIVYPSVEHAYQALKTLDQGTRRFIARAPSAAAAKRLGRRVTLREGWEGMRLQVMYGLLWLKFTDPDLRARLIATAPKELVEGNYWGDRFWGVCAGQGENHLGLLLMRLRNSLVAQQGGR